MGRQLDSTHSSLGLVLLAVVGCSSDGLRPDAQPADGRGLDGRGGGVGLDAKVDMAADAIPTSDLMAFVDAGDASVGASRDAAASDLVKRSDSAPNPDAPAGSDATPPPDADLPVRDGGGSKWPSLEEPWGHAHPTCAEDYGRTPEQIEATPCATRTPSGDTTLTACSINGIVDLIGTGDDITLDCVYLHLDAPTSTLTRCAGAGGCANFRFLRSTCRGAGSAGPGKCIGLANHGGQGFTSVHIDRADIYRNEVPLFATLGAGAALPGSDVHMLVTRTRVHEITDGPSFHTDGVFVTGPGVHRFEGVAIYVSDRVGNVGSTLSGPGQHYRSRSYRVV